MSEMTEEKIKEEKAKYTRKIEIPIYEPNNIMPNIKELYNKEKTDYLIQRIKESDVPENIKEFLYSAAERHTQFDFSKIADFYAHSDLKVKRLFEESALVIIDYDAAIRNGFISYQKCVDEDLEEYLNSLSDEDLDSKEKSIKKKLIQKNILEEIY